MKEPIIKIVIGIILVFLIIFLGVSIKSLIYEMNYNFKILSIGRDDIEIEKKWLIDKTKIPYDLSKAEKFEIEQTYISFSPEIRVRKINNGEEYTFAVKTNMTSDGLIRDEMENTITEEEYNNMIKKKEGNTIYKTRYQFLEDNILYAIDIFKDDLEGLAYMEIEFENKELSDEFETPSWVIKDVTADVRYKNGHLAKYGIPE